jgi:hypothetical protein
MRLLLAVAVTFLAGAAWAGDGIVPETDKPDVVYIGEGWAPSLKDGCLDRGECKLPELPKAERHSGPFAIPGKNLNFGRDCTGSLQGVAGIRAMYDAVARCVGG